VPSVPLVHVLVLTADDAERAELTTRSIARNSPGEVLAVAIGASGSLPHVDEFVTFDELAQRTGSDANVSVATLTPDELVAHASALAARHVVETRPGATAVVVAPGVLVLGDLASLAADEAHDLTVVTRAALDEDAGQAPDRFSTLVYAMHSPRAAQALARVTENWDRNPAALDLVASHLPSRVLTEPGALVAIDRTLSSNRFAREGDRLTIDGERVLAVDLP
jgi:hypothetical protein